MSTTAPHTQDMTCRVNLHREMTPPRVKIESGNIVVADCIGNVAHAERIVACVNACRGMADPAKEIEQLRRLRWITLNERMPTEDDANDSHDVEWSNSGDIWQAHFTDSELATHWRPITLP